MMEEPTSSTPEEEMRGKPGSSEDVVDFLPLIPQNKLWERSALVQFGSTPQTCSERRAETRTFLFSVGQESMSFSTASAAACELMAL